MALIESILIIVIIIIIVVIIWNLFYKNSSQLLLDGVHKSTPLKLIKSNALPDNVSSNFTWAIWFFINDWNTNYGIIKPLLVQSSTQPDFSSQSSQTTTPSINSLWSNSYDSENSPKLPPNNDFAIAFDKYENDVLVGIKTFAQTTNSHSASYNLPSTDYFSQQLLSTGTQKDQQDYRYETYKVNNVDLQKWVCLIISVDGRTLDIYLHGKLVKTFVLPNTVPGEKDDVYVGSNSSYAFDGHYAMVRYIPNAVNTQQAYNIYRDGLGSSWLGDFWDKYQLKIQFMEYNNPVGKPLII